MAPRTRFTYRHQYDDAADAIERANTDIYNEEESKTQQHHKDEVDLNVIVARYGITDGAIPPAATDPRYFGDFSDAPTFREALDRTHTAKERFAMLPANIRERFNHSPLKLWEFVSNPDNAEEAVRLGLLKKTPEAAAPAVVATPAKQD